jgi:predicted lipid-binding transport protein (Tim44 family)
LPFLAVTSIPNDNDQMQDNTDEQCDAAHAEHQQMMTGDMMGGQMMGDMAGGQMMGGDMMGGATPRTSPSVPVEPSED